MVSAVAAEPPHFARTLLELRSQLDAHVQQPRFSGALWGGQVASLTSGKIVYEFHADRLLSPAMTKGPSVDTSDRTGARPPFNDGSLDGGRGGSSIRFSSTATLERYRAPIRSSGPLWQT